MRVDLAPGESKRLSFQLSKESFSFYDERSHDWTLPRGLFTVRLGASSRDIRLFQTFELK